MNKTRLMAAAIIAAAFFVLPGRQPDPASASRPRDVGLDNILAMQGQGPAVARARVTIATEARTFGSSREQQLQELKRQSADWGRQECEALMKTLASVCRVNSATPDLWGKSALLTLTMEFAPTDDTFGDRKPEDGMRVHAFDLDYDNGDRIARDHRALAAARSRIYAQMRRDCLETREIYGNCLVYRIRIDSTLGGPVGEPRVFISGKASVAVRRPSRIKSGRAPRASVSSRCRRRRERATCRRRRLNPAYRRIAAGVELL